MKKSLNLTFCGLLISGFLAGHVEGQSVDDVLEKMIKALGGRAKLEAVKDVTITHTFKMMETGMSGSMTRFQKNPSMLRMDINVMGRVITQAYDGQAARTVNPQTGAAEDMPAEEAESFVKDALGYEALLDPRKHGLTYAVKGKEIIDGKEYIVLEQKFSDEYTITQYIDPKTYLPYKAVAKAYDRMLMETEGETIFTDYREVDGIVVAYNLMIFEGREEKITLTVMDVTFNSGLEDSLFKMEGSATRILVQFRGRRSPS
jgi:outer membrane lipoprotein-sorting protein